jgi:hypothetical protein
MVKSFNFELNEARNSLDEDINQMTQELYALQKKNVFSTLRLLSQMRQSGESSFNFCMMRKADTSAESLRYSISSVTHKYYLSILIKVLK